MHSNHIFLSYYLKRGIYYLCRCKCCNVRAWCHREVYVGGIPEVEVVEYEPYGLVSEYEDKTLGKGQ